MIRLKSVALLLGIAASLSAGSPVANLSIGTGTVTAGHSAALTVGLVNQGPALTTVQFDLLYDKVSLAITITPGGAGNTAISSISGGQRVSVTAQGQSVIGNGNVAYLAIAVAANAAAGNYPLALANAGGTDSQANPITVNANGGSLTVYAAPAISAPPSLPAGTVNAAYPATTLSATGGTGSYTWSATYLPSGLSIGPSNGIITGTPTTYAAGVYNVQITLTDGNSATANRAYSLTVNAALQISGQSSLPGGTVGTAYSTILTATGGSGTYTWSAPGLPPGLAMTPGTGAITGTPTSGIGSPFSVQVTVTDGNLVTANRGFSIAVYSPLVVSGPASLPVGTVNSPYPATSLTASGGTGIYTWTAPGLPNGLTVAPATGAITGSPNTVSGSPFHVQVTVTDSNSSTATFSYTVVVDPALVISLPSSLSSGALNVAYPSTTVTATGGNGNYSWTQTGLPPGMTIDSVSGAITGTPTSGTGSPYTVRVTVTDTTSAIASVSYRLTISTPLAISGPSSIPVATLNSQYPSTTIVAIGGNGSYTWSALGLPAGMSIVQATGLITGAPMTIGGSPLQVQVTVTDGSSTSANRTYTLTVNPGIVIPAPSVLPAGIVGSAYPSTAVTASGGSGTYTWTAPGLPPGLGINLNSGAITGTPTTNSGSPYAVVVMATDANSATAIRTYSLTVTSSLTVAAPALLPAGTLGTLYPATTVTTSGGTGPYTWSAPGLPAGLSINSSTGVITGTPTSNTGSPYTVVVTVTDSTTSKATRTYSLVINTPLSISGPASLPVGTAGVAYPGTTITATGGEGPYAWTVTGLPFGLFMGASTGIIAGTPNTGTGSPFTIQVTVTDGASATAKRNYTLTVNAGMAISGPPSLPAGTVGMPYPPTTITATGVTGTCNWWITGLPSGMSIDSTTGIVSGTPTSNIGSPFQVVAWLTDSTSAKAAHSYSLIINPAVTTLPTVAQVANSAGGQTGLAPNTWTSIYGTNFAPAGFVDDWSKSIVTGKLPVTLDGVSVRIGGQAADVAYVSATQLNILTPDVGLGPLQLIVTTPAGTSAPVTVTAQQVSPALFSWPNNQPVATHLDYSWAVKDGTFPGTPTVASKPGETIILWGSGFGPTNPIAPSGVQTPVTPLFPTASLVTVTIGGTPAAVYAATLAPGYAGLYQVAVTIPASMPNGDYPIIAMIGGVQSPSTAILTIHN